MVAQRNRRRARGGGPNPRKARRPDGLPDADGTDGAEFEGEVQHPFAELVSGEEALEEAQLAFGRPELNERPDGDELTTFEESESARDDDAAPSGAAGALSTRRASRRHAVDEDVGALERTHKVGLVAQLIGFFIGAYGELQRVQWPDRRQVFQATGVVLGFVIVAGAFLAVASLAAQKVVSLILYGHG